MSIRRFWISSGALSAFVVLALGSGDSTDVAKDTSAPTQAETVDAAAPIKIKKAVLARRLSDTKQPLDPTTVFRKGDKVNISLAIAGRPKQGVIHGTFYHRETEIIALDYDLKDINAGVLLSMGETTWVGLSMTLPEPIIGGGYHVDVSCDGVDLGSYPFSFAPPEGALESKMLAPLILAKGATDSYKPIDPTEVFSTGDTVHVVGEAQFGIKSWLQVEWIVAGTRDDKGTRSLTLKENTESAPFVFNFVPEGGWPAGEHKVLLILDGVDVETKTFTVQ